MFSFTLTFVTLTKTIKNGLAYLTSGWDDDVAEEDVADHPEDEDDAVEREEDPSEIQDKNCHLWSML